MRGVCAGTALAFWACVSIMCGLAGSALAFQPPMFAMLTAVWLICGVPVTVLGSYVTVTFAPELNNVTTLLTTAAVRYPCSWKDTARLGSLRAAAAMLPSASALHAFYLAVHSLWNGFIPDSGTYLQLFVASLSAQGFTTALSVLNTCVSRTFACLKASCKAACCSRHVASLGLRGQLHCVNEMHWLQCA